MTDNKSTKSSETNPPKRRTIRFQLLVAVNSTLAVLLTLFLIYDYRSELADRLSDKRIALEEEAKTLLPAIVQMRHHGDTEVQRYIDDVCARMQDSESPAHHIAVRLDGKVLQASLHHRASPEMLQAMQQAATSATNIATDGEAEVVVGAFGQGETIVYVSEALASIRTAVLGDLMRRTAGVVILGIVAGGVVNVVLWLIVTRPLHQLVGTMQKIGQGQLGVQSNSFTSAELDYLADEINAMSKSLADADAYRNAQMAKARKIQQHLQPEFVEIAGVSIEHHFQPADEVGGDYYDILPLTDGAWLFCVADVSGHGIPAAMSAAMLKTHLLHATERRTCPAEILRFVNQRFSEVVFPGDFVSMALAHIDLDTNQIQYASAGHEKSWVLSVDRSRHELPSTGPILGVEDDASWGIIATDVCAGDRLYMFTDGLTETFNEREEVFGATRLVDLFSECVGLSLEEVVQKVDRTLKEFRSKTPQRDDCTLLVAEFHRNQNE